MSDYRFDWSEARDKGVVHVTVRDELPVGSGHYFEFCLPVSVESVEKILTNVFEELRAKEQN